VKPKNNLAKMLVYIVFIFSHTSFTPYNES